MRIKCVAGVMLRRGARVPLNILMSRKGRIFVTNPSVVLLNKYLFEIHLDKLYTGAETGEAINCQISVKLSDQRPASSLTISWL